MEVDEKYQSAPRMGHNTRCDNNHIFCILAPSETLRLASKDDILA
jgi:hypothetical protein